jgi:hypothetical protein
MSSNQALMPDRHKLPPIVDEPAGPIDYMQERNQDALRAWRRRLAGESAGVRNSLQQATFHARQQQPSPGAWR